jgi:hypothetical protein
MTMKREILYTLIFALAIFVTGCKYDNYDPPTSMLTGTVNYQGAPVGVKSGGNQLELWQYGFKLRSKIAVYIDQDGTYSARLFDGNYKLVRLKGAPWTDQTDSIDVAVKGNTVVDVPVTPYFNITAPAFSFADSTITASGLVTKIGTKNIERVTLYVGYTTIVDATNVGTYTDYSFNPPKTVTLKLDKTGAAIANLTSPLTFSYRLHKLVYAKQYVYARLGVKTSGVSEMYYTPAQKFKIR